MVVDKIDMRWVKIDGKFPLLSQRFAVARPPRRRQPQIPSSPYTQLCSVVLVVFHVATSNSSSSSPADTQCGCVLSPAISCLKQSAKWVAVATIPQTIFLPQSFCSYTQLHYFATVQSGAIRVGNVVT